MIHLPLKVSGLMFLNTHLTSSTCTLLQFISGLSPSLMFAAILVKTRKVYHVFNAKIMENNRVSEMVPSSLNFCPEVLEEKLERMMAPKPRQIVSIAFLVIIQFIFISIWSMAQAANMLG